MAVRAATISARAATIAARATNIAARASASLSGDTPWWLLRSSTIVEKATAVLFLGGGGHPGSNDRHHSFTGHCHVFGTASVAAKTASIALQ